VRIPPPLDGVGAKLKEAWLAKVITTGAKDRAYMLTRMPNFDAKNVGGLASQFAAMDYVEPLAHLPLNRAVALDAGRDMAGNKGFACINCHPFRRYKAISVQSMDMTIMTKRLREDWFRRYLRDPQSYRPGTRMPTWWFENDPNPIPEVLDGDTEKQIQALWVYLSDGAQAKTPAGLGDQFLELIPEDNAIIYRFSIEGARPRAIGVGFPEGIHMAFDADDSRLALIWQGGFIDAGPHWRGEGEGFQPPLGEKVKSLVPGVPLAKLSSPSEAWPEGTGKKLGVRFIGYRLSSNKRPTFLYRFGDLKVEDTPNPCESSTGGELVRELRFSGSAEENHWFRAARSSTIIEDDGWYVFDEIRMRIESSNSAKPLIRQQGGADELLVAVTAPMVITQRFHW